MLRHVTHKKASCASQSSFCNCGTLQYSALVNSVLINLKKFGLNLTFAYKYTSCMAWRFHFPIRKYDFKGLHQLGCHCIEAYNFKVLLSILLLSLPPPSLPPSLPSLPHNYTGWFSCCLVHCLLDISGCCLVIYAILDRWSSSILSRHPIYHL